MDVYSEEKLVGTLDVRRDEHRHRGVWIVPVERHAKWVWPSTAGEPGSEEWAAAREKVIEEGRIGTDAEWTQSTDAWGDTTYFMEWYVLEFAPETVERIFDWPEYQPV